MLHRCGKILTIEEYDETFSLARDDVVNLELVRVCGILFRRSSLMALNEVEEEIFGIFQSWNIFRLAKEIPSWSGSTSHLSQKAFCVCSGQDHRPTEVARTISQWSLFSEDRFLADSTPGVVPNVSPAKYNPALVGRKASIVRPSIPLPLSFGGRPGKFDDAPTVRYSLGNLDKNKGLAPRLTPGPHSGLL